MAKTLIFLLLLLLLLRFLPTMITSLELLPPISFSYFNYNSLSNFILSTDSSTSQGALQITPDTSNNITYLANKSGRVLFKDPFTLWTQPTATAKSVASFNTTFTINIYRLPSASPGEGFSFLIAPSLNPPPDNSHGGFLGLTNRTLDRSESNHIVAIELDTVKQDHDPDDNHIGLDINSVVSNVTSSLHPFGIAIAPAKAANYTLWIDYDGLAKHVAVYMAVQHVPKPPLPVLHAPLDISMHVMQKSYFGFAASTGSTNYQLNCVLAWNLTVEKLDGDDDYSPKHGMKLVAAIGVPVLVIAIVALTAIVACIVRRRKVGDAVGPSALAGTLKSLPGTPKEFEFKVLKKATGDFDEKMKLGQGGFGVVYKGVIPGDNIPVAVKKFSRDDIKGQDDFLAELSIINRLRHKNLVRLLGWCHKNGMLLLVYEFMPNGSLDQHLFGGPSRPPLTWTHRYNILTGVATALHYLHSEYNQMVVHRDLKASNVLLDSSFNARLGDFGLARALDADKTSYVDVELGGVAGTMGYIAPECFHTGRATRQSDVFAFGALVLEVICSRRPRCDIGGFQFLVDWVWMLHRERRICEAVDGRLEGDFDEEDAVRLLLLGLSCSHPSLDKRPSTTTILQNISRSVPPLSVPPFKPSFVWPSAQALDEDDTNSGSMTSTVVMSPYYVSSSGWTPRAPSLKPTNTSTMLSYSFPE